MFEAELKNNNDIKLTGRFDASQVENAKEVFNSVTSSCEVDFTNLEYISSAGLSVLLVTQKRLSESGNSQKLPNMNRHVRDVFRYAGFDTVFAIE